MAKTQEVKIGLKRMVNLITVHYKSELVGKKHREQSYVDKT